MSNLMQSVKDNVAFLGVCLLIVVAIFVVASVTEKALRKKNSMPRTNSPARRVALVGVFSAIAAVLMLFELPLWFAPSFYELDFSEVPILIGAFALGPVAGVLTELVKILLNLVINGTNTAFVGEFANFVMGCAFVVPASVIYKRKKNRQHAMIGLVAGTVIMSAAAVFINALVLLPAYAKAFGMPVDAFVQMGTAINPAINGIWTFVLLAVAPFNLIKGVLVSVITVLLYKHISPILKGTR